jgi:hypothetical protein
MENDNLHEITDLQYSETCLNLTLNKQNSCINQALNKSPNVGNLC